LPNVERPRLALAQGPAGSFQELCARYLVEYSDKIRLGVSRLTEDQVWWRPAAGANAAGNLILHICGNLSLWIRRTLAAKRSTAAAPRSSRRIGP
jgi:hypothetical protein